MQPTSGGDLLNDPRNWGRSVFGESGDSLFQACDNVFPARTGSVTLLNEDSPQRWLTTVTINSADGLLSIVEAAQSTVPNFDGACPASCFFDDAQYTKTYEYTLATGAYTVTTRTDRHFRGINPTTGVQLEQVFHVEGGESGVWPLIIIQPTHLEIVSARMISNNRLQVMTRRDFADLTGLVSLRMTINGQSISVAKTLGTNVNDSDSTGNFVDHTPFIIDLERYAVRRFRSNQVFFVQAQALLSDGTTLEAPSAFPAAVLLPTVIVPGICLHFEVLGYGCTRPLGGDGTFPILEAELIDLSRTTFGEDSRYRWDNVNVAYPTLFTLSYDRDFDSFFEGAQKLGALIAEIKSRTYADTVNLVTHSKGGLVARKFVVAHPNDVSKLIMTAPPNVGSMDPGILSHNFYASLQPLWPWYRKKATQQFKITQPEDRELAFMNRHEHLPASIRYAIIFSNSAAFTPFGIALTPFTQTVRPPSIGLTGGDSIVPGFSAIGLILDPNDNTAKRIEAFAGIHIDEVQVAGWHGGYIELPEVVGNIFVRLAQ
jgi:pimeloyl-ACP methyl ester carboxylesterase